MQYKHAFGDVLIVAFLTALATACRPSVEVPQDNDAPTLANLQGEWRLVSAVGEGEPIPASDLQRGGFVLRIGNDDFTIADGNGKVREAGKLVIDASAYPVRIDQIIEQGADKGTTELGIVRIKNGSLWWNEAHPGHERPSEFAAPEGSHCTLAEFRPVR